MAVSRAGILILFAFLVMSVGIVSAETWTLLTDSPGWSPRMYSSSVVLPDGSIVLMGGYDGGPVNDVWKSSDGGATWTLLTNSAGWLPRYLHESILLPDGSIVLMGGWLGGSSPQYYQDDEVWKSSDGGATWTLLTDSPGWNARNSFCTVVLPDGSIILMGGERRDALHSNDVWRSTDGGSTWTLVTASAGWSPRKGSSALVFTDGSIVLTGGYDDTISYNDVWKSTDGGATWTELTNSAGWSPRYFHLSHVAPDGSIVLLGGTDRSMTFNDVWRSTDRGSTWTLVTASADWSPRVGFGDVILPDGRNILMGGGIDNPGYPSVIFDEVWSDGIVSATEPQILENRSYGTTSYDGFYKIIPNGNGGYLVAGAQHNNWGDPANLYNVWLINFDDSNSIIWEKTYDLGTLDSAQTVMRDSDGGFITGGWSYNAVNLLKVNSNGDKLWSKVYSAGAFSVIDDIQKSGSYYYAGGTFYNEPYVFRFDNTNGDLLWSVSTNPSLGQILGIVPAADDTCMFVGYVGQSDDVIIGKVNASGNIIWKKILNKQDKDSGFAIDKLLDGTYIAAAYTDREDYVNAATWIINFDEEGNILREKIIDGPQYNGPFDVTATSDGGFIVAGITDFAEPFTGDLRSPTGDAWFIKFDSAFNEQWNLTAGGSKSEVARSIIEIGDGLFRFAGATRSYGNGYTDGWIGKIGYLNQPPENNAPVLAPIGNKMVDEGQVLSFSLSATDPDGTPLTFSATGLPDGATFTTDTFTWTPTFTQAGIYAVTFTVSDGSLTDSEDIMITVNNVNRAPNIDVINAPLEPITKGSSVITDASFTDPDTDNTHIASCNWGDGTGEQNCNIEESGGSGTIRCSHVFSTPGVYIIDIKLNDNYGLTDIDSFSYVVIYDPEGGFVTGGGWIMSPPGAYIQNPTLTDKATFGFVSKYQKGANVPTGQTEFQFKVASLNFKSTIYDWLVVAGPKAQYKGIGKINGNGEYKFILTAIDGQIAGGGGSDKFRIKIWESGTDILIYDNQISASDTADPTTIIGGGSIVNHKS